MAPRLLLLHLGAAAAAASCCLCLLAAASPADAAPRMPPSRDVIPAGTAAVASAPAAGVPRAAVDLDDDGMGVPTTVPAPDASAAAAVTSVFRHAQHLGAPRHLRLSADNVPADAPAAISSSDAPAPSGVHAAASTRTSLLAIFSPVFFVLGCGLFVAGLLKSSNLCAAAKARRQKARRVHPLGQDAVEAAAGP